MEFFSLDVGHRWLAACGENVVSVLAEHTRPPQPGSIPKICATLQYVAPRSPQTRPGGFRCATRAMLTWYSAATIRRNPRSAVPWRPQQPRREPERRCRLGGVSPATRHCQVFLDPTPLPRCSCFVPVDGQSGRAVADLQVAAPRSVRPGQRRVCPARQVQQVRPPGASADRPPAGALRRADAGRGRPVPAEMLRVRRAGERAASVRPDLRPGLSAEPRLGVYYRLARPLGVLPACLVARNQPR